MRAEASSDSARDFRRHSQRVTRRSELAGFHPLPPQTGQTSAATFMNNLCFECALWEWVCARGRDVILCAHPVELWKGCGELGSTTSLNNGGSGHPCKPK